MPRDHSREQPQWLLARHSALTARQLLRAYGLLCLFSLTIAAVFALRGIWTIPVFSVAELGLVAIALLHCLRHPHTCSCRRARACGQRTTPAWCTATSSPTT